MAKLGPRGEALIKSYEKLRLKAYRPTPNDVWTIGWGHTRGVKEDDTCTKEQAQAWFEQDVEEAERAVGSMSDLGVILTESMADALISLVFNVGSRPLSAMATIGVGLRAGDYYVAWQGFTNWKRQGAKVLLGLARRRAREMVLFLEDGIPK